MIRLDKMLAHMGYGSRKEVKELIRKGYVSVDGEIIYSDDYKVKEDSEIIIFDEVVKYDEFVYLMLNKPDGYISATFDNNIPTVLDLIYGYESRNLFPVGRLDIDTYGLLILTNDGKLAHKLLSPKNHVNKKYYVKYDGKYNDKFIEIFKKGIPLEDFTCKPAEFVNLGNNEAYITISEGKFHQIKRMMEYVGCSVTYLERIEFGPLKLDSNLKRKEFRPLTKEEIELLKAE
jgi:16S rRNA pseudouridine516 synthase